MKNLSTFNKIFLVVCAALIAFLAFAVPHEKNEPDKQQAAEKAYRN